MEIYTDNWFKYVRENVLAEGLRDIGLPEFVIDYLEDAMPDASEKARMYIANGWKQSRGTIAGYYTVESFRYEVLSFLIKQLEEYVIKQHQSVGDDIEARTLPSYNMDEPEKEREMYDDERIKQNEQVKFVVQNIVKVVGKPMGQWRKAFMKAVKGLSKAGLPSEKVESIKEYLRSTYAKAFHQWLNQYTELVSFLNDDATNYELIKDEYSILDAQKYAERYLQSQENPENIMHQFDDGYYWYNLDKSSCDVEAQRMGHCGSDSRGVLVSLRKKKSKRRESSSYVTMTYSDYQNTVYQIKGRSNDAPIEDVWDHIAWFINNMGVDNVEETGEHSGDIETIQEMVEYLASQTNASFHGSIEDRIEKAEEYCANVEQRYRDNQDEMEYGSVSYSLEEMDAQDIYCYASADYSFEINLGWTGIEETDTGYKAEGADFEEIPRTYSKMREFIDEISVDDMMYEMPGDDGDYEYEVEMIVGVNPGPYDPDAAPTAHLRIRMYTNETLSVDEDGEVPEFDEFVDNMLAFEEDTADNYREQIRQNLAEGGYMAKTAYDRSKEELMKLTNLDKWHVKQQGSMLEFDWTADDGQPLHSYSGQPALDDVRAQMYGTGTGNRMGINPDAVMREMFGFGQRYSFANKQGINDPVIANAFARELSRGITAQIKSRRAAPGQQSFDFGDQYKDIDPTMILADDTDFVVFSDVKYHGGPFSSQGSTRRYPSMGIKWLYRMRISPESEPDEAEVIQDIAAYLNEHEELVTQAADKVIGMYVEGMMENIQKRKDKVMSNQEIQDLINRGMETYGRIDADGSAGELANKIVTILQWFESNYSDMGEAERYVMVTKFLIPIAQNNFRSYSDMGQIDNNTGAPVMFGELAAAQKEMMGGQPVNMARAQGQTMAGSVGEPRPAQESMEAQIDRIEKLLRDQKDVVAEVDDSYDLRIYNIQVGCTVDAEVGGSESETQTEIRGVPGVTTVRPVAARKRQVTPTAEYVLYDIKFELLGAKSRVEYRDEVLLPALRQIRGLKILTVSSMHRTNRKGTIRTVRESNTLAEYGFGGSLGGFGGLAGQLGSQRYTQGREMPTPRPMIQRLIDDWAEGGVMGYDAPANTNDMRYHTMFPVEELLPFIEDKEYRGDVRDFEGRYRNFIKTGPTAPVYLAIGKLNKTAKVTGGEEFIFFAKKAGLKELPVFISYQRQV